ncbi:hypothetical protein SteCoe_7819 [Stentor coeruleus]|uniref:EF-hand domain-containing protein n=1 Tax=Stentor coeruleus TaxID=5963 RepID=A0A1R2CLV9_9CILI|nr:hypothetical protein SteCoe_7819 [Stentor coeruleus]
MSNNLNLQARFKEDTLESSSQSSEESHEEPLVHYKGKYSAERLMMMLDKEKLEALEEEFNDHPDGIELHNFVWLMKCAMTVAPEEKAELVLGLYYLFQEIDINGDEHMEWSEFTQYIIDAVMGQQNKEKSEEKELSPSEIMEMAHSHKSRRYQLSKLIDRSFHGSFLRQANFHSNLDLVSVVEMGGQSVKFFNVQSEVKFQITPQYANNGFVLSVAYSEREYLLVIAGSDRVLYTYEKENSYFRHARDFKTDFTHLSIWYIEEQKSWISACDDHNLRQWNMRTGELLFCFMGHDEIILDVVEIINPLCIASASLDGIILLWDLADQKNIGSLSGKHSRGVRSIDYSSEYGGNIVSVGYERDIHVWSPEVTLSKCYAGKLEGHNCPVVSCKFFKGRPICISVDEKGNVRLWDIRQFSCLQIITHERGKIEVSKLVTIAKHDKFIVAGRRLIWYELMKDSMMKSNYKDVNPILAEFNTYYLQFVVLTKYDLRVYDCVSGKLRKIYTEVQDPRTESELSAMVLDHRNRICLIGDNSGSIRAYNFANGALMKSVNGEGRDNKLSTEEDEVDNIEQAKSAKKNEDWNSEISALHFCTDDKILIASSWDSSIMVYDMKDIEEVALLRVMKGGHQGSDITCITYSPYLSLIASGSSNGIVAIWDFEIGKLEGACFGHKRDITAISFLEPYPVMITFSSDGMICLWNIRAHNGKARFRCIARFKNTSWTGSQDEKSAISVTLNIISCQKGIQRHKRKKHTKQKKNEPKPEKEKTSFNFFKTRENEKPPESDEESVYEWIEDQNVEIIDEAGLNAVKNRPYLYVGDAKGYIKIWSFENFLSKKKFVPLERMERDKPSYNPRRKDIKNAESDVKYWKKETENEDFPNIVDTEGEILVREWKAHDDIVNCIRPILEPQGLLTCSPDKFLKVWNREGEIWGIINLSSPEVPKKWYFPFDWEAKRQQDINKVIEVLSLIDEKVDIDPSTLPAAPSQAQPSKKKRRPKMPKTRQKLTQPKPQSNNPVHHYEEEKSEDEVEDPNEKPHTTLKKYYGSAADLKKQLDELDEKRVRDYEDLSIKDNTKKPSKTRNRLEAENRKLEVSKSQGPQRLPKIGSTRVKAKNSSEKVEGTPVKTFYKSNSRQEFPDMQEKYIKVKSESKRPLIGFGSTGVVSNFVINKPNQSKIKIKKDKLYDVRYKPGESIRMLNKAISSQSLAISSVLSPYTEDLKTLKKKNELIKDLAASKKSPSMASLPAVRKDLGK